MLAEDLARFYNDPYGYVMWAFPWGEGQLKGYHGPRTWQEKYLKDLGNKITASKFNGIDPVDPLRISRASGHGIGKSALTAWLIKFILDTRPYSKGVVTANTSDQLKTKTWAEVGKWHNLSLTSGQFMYRTSKGNMNLTNNNYPESWRCDAMTCREENSESFAGLHSSNSTPFYIFDEACHDDKTEVLTKAGWRLFKDVAKTDKLLTMDPKTRRAFYIKPKAIHVMDAPGKVFSYANMTSNFRVTRGHKMYLSTKSGSTNTWGDFKLRDIESLGKNAEYKMLRNIKWEVKDKSHFTIPGFKSSRKLYEARKVNFDLWAEFLGWYISEGHTSKRTNRFGKIEHTSAFITQQLGKNLDRITEIIETLGFKYSLSCIATTPQIAIHDRALAEYLTKHGKSSLEKRAPECIRFASTRQINIFLDAFVLGDGYDKEGIDIMYTSSKQLSGELQELALKGGAGSTVNVRRIKGQRKWVKDHWATSSCDGYVVSRSFKSGKICFKSKQIKELKYSGKAYCAELEEYHLLFTRREGKTLWSGNSAIPEKIFDVAQGGLTDGEPMWFLFGNPTRNTGFFRQTFGRNKHRWDSDQIDSRDVEGTNKKLFGQWIEDYGDDSDFVRVRIKGTFPRAAVCQLIPTDLVENALGKHLNASLYSFAPKVLGVDVAWYGDDRSCIWIRQGLASRLIWQGREVDSIDIAGLIAQYEDKYKTHATFIDAGMGNGVIDQLRRLGRSPNAVYFGGKSSNAKYHNKRAEMWGETLEWLKLGGALPKDNDILEDLTAPEYHMTLKGSIQLERKEDMKKRGLSSPDLADGLALTFAAPVLVPSELERYSREPDRVETDYELF